VAVICAAMAGLIGAMSGKEVGAAMGVVNGLAVGYTYVHFALLVRKGNAFSKILTRTGYGSVAGLVSGGLVHVPGLFNNYRDAHNMLGLGTVAGIVIGTVFGFILACLFAVLPEPQEEAKETAAK
jgi:hypothetical protein